MDLNQLKIELIQKIISCDDEDILREIEQVLNENSSGVKEEGEKYVVQEKSALVPDSYYEELEEDYEKYKRGELKTSSWNEVKERLREKYDF